VLVSSNLLEQNSGPGFYYQAWFGEVKNAGTQLTCLVKINLTISPGPGQPLSLVAYADSSPAYQFSGESLSISCLAPGQTGALWANNISSVTADVLATQSIVYQFAGLPGTIDTPNVAMPMVTATLTNAGALGFDVEGTMTAVADISNIELPAYVRDATGLIQDRITAVDLGALAAGASWSYVTNYTSAAAVSHLDGISFIAAVTPMVSGHPSPAPEFAVHREAQRALSEQRAARARAALPR
jgi:hypothetical protein